MSSCDTQRLEINLYDSYFCLDENHVPLIIPDLYDDGAWEKLLLLSPSKRKNAKKGKDDETLKEEEDETMVLDKSGTLKLIQEELEREDEFDFGQLTPERWLSANLRLIKLNVNC
ncbi:unnamed protein product [Eruca vesicaria subsp. sativa]|uniref:Uncharacterized protein n=1 Tax=Eruca vesicaria subsp. sativa TaxID=29727 RepID=A0ABC8LGR3_ERUVS|nr:unnamed protein product [Eruca vesicaria subsp. sativa]